MNLCYGVILMPFVGIVLVLVLVAEVLVLVLVLEATVLETSMSTVFCTLSKTPFALMLLLITLRQKGRAYM